LSPTRLLAKKKRAPETYFRTTLKTKNRSIP
jgi:hypothetical protein